ncbi:MAG: MoxR family ATPase [Synergistaceae bacterium]|jgi:MoxR-like ATPase|nr:MoxR family ATPase [Synergistaceae bacterium]
MDLQYIADIANVIRYEIHKVIIGQDETLDLMLTSLLCGGHALLEGAPGTGKTFMVQAFASCLNLQFGRVQFTPDMMPGDVLGTNIFDFRTNAFVLTKGPIFTQILLADEINRTPPKTQAALLQAMNERQVSIDKVTYDLGEDFMVVATQNPIEQQGTYPLPEAQLDRFLFKLVVDYPSEEEELEIVRSHGHRSAMPKISEYGLSPKIERGHIAASREYTARIRLSEELVGYIVDIVRATRRHQMIDTGASPRAANMMASASRAYAALKGRDFVIPDDVKHLALPLLRHRIVLSAEADIDGMSADQAISAVIDQTPAPR